mmetsp:Transcript_39913/g.99323  ORF Transcript_39913/g.99323 Transcript_39913/m.99323 type:complete len:82 (-) Transcript_39913:98-343(-)|eukprot:4988752-Prymnesium_polylepis.2
MTHPCTMALFYVWVCADVTAHMSVPRCLFVIAGGRAVWCTVGQHHYAAIAYATRVPVSSSGAERLDGLDFGALDGLERLMD